MADVTTFTLDSYAAEARAWVASAQQLADEHQHAEVQPIHLLHRGVSQQSGVAEVLRRAGMDVVKLQQATARAVASLPRGSEPAYLSRALLGLLKRAERSAVSGSSVSGSAESRSASSRAGEGSRAVVVQVADLLRALTQEVSGPVADVLGEFNVGPGTLNGFLSELVSTSHGANLGGASPSVSDLVVDLVELARAGKLDPVVGRQYEVHRVLTILERRQKQHPLLVGEPGVGKGSVLRGLAHKIALGDVPTSLAEVRLLEVDVGALTAGTRLRGEAETRLRKLIESTLRSGSPRSILVVRSLTRLLGSGPTSPALGDLLTSTLSRGQLRLLGTTSPDGWSRIQSQDPALARGLTVIQVDEPNQEQTADIVRGVSGAYERHHRVQVSEGAVLAAASLAKRYVPDRFLPDSALDLLDEAAARRRVEADGLSMGIDRERSELSSLKAQLSSLEPPPDEQSRRKSEELRAKIAELEPRVEAQRSTIEARREAVKTLRLLSEELSNVEQQRDEALRAQNFARVGELDHGSIPELKSRIEAAESAVQQAGFEPLPSVLEASHVAATLAEWTGIPVAKMLEGEAEKLLKMEERLGQRVIGQLDAVRAIARAVRRGRVGLSDPRRPIGSFLFLGTSGVGKTELAKALAEFLFDDEHALTRLDMSEFMERHMAQRLLGAPPGYADSDQGGFLTEAVRRRPYSVLLFDEVEKAHQDVFNLLLQVLDDGRLTDGRGRTADFTNTVVIMTSNIGAERIMDAEPSAFESEQGRETLKQALLDRLREFFRPELLNRIGDTVVFRPLDKTDLRKIIELQLGKVQRLLSRRELRLDVSDDAKDRLVDLGYEPALGARPLERVVLRYLQDPLAEELLRGGYQDGQTIRVTLDGEQFQFQSG